MKTSRIALSCMTGLLLAGCSTTGERSTYVPPEREPSIMDDDEEYIAYVERVARRRGLHLTWVNPPPRRRMPETGETP